MRKVGTDVCEVHVQSRKDVALAQANGGNVQAIRSA